MFFRSRPEVGFVPAGGVRCVEWSEVEKGEERSEEKGDRGREGGAREGESEREV